MKVQKVKMGISECLRILGFDKDKEKNITWKKVRKAYRCKILKHHPDKGGVKENFQEIIQAFKELEMNRDTFEKKNTNDLDNLWKALYNTK